MTLQVWEARLPDEQATLLFWNRVQPEFEKALLIHRDPTVVDGSLEFHRRALLAMVASGFHNVRYIQVDTGFVPIARSGGEEEHWWFIGSLLNCSFEPPCSPEQLKRALQFIPAIADPYIHPRVLTACQLVPTDEACEFDVPKDFDAYVQAAPKKQRGEWGRLMRKADAAGFQWQWAYRKQAFEAAHQLIDQYSAYWVGRNDSASDESQMMRETLKAFEAAEDHHWLAIVIADKDTRPLAVNFAWIKRGVVYDTICIRDVRDDLRPYSLGVLAILYNLKTASERQYVRYSLASGDQQYKRQFNYEKPTEQSNLSCLSDIDIVLNNYPGYYNGHWVTAEEPVYLSPATVAHIHEQYPFTLEEEE